MDEELKRKVSFMSVVGMIIVLITLTYFLVMSFDGSLTNKKINNMIIMNLIWFGVTVHYNVKLRKSGGQSNG